MRGNSYERKRARVERRHEPHEPPRTGYGRKQAHEGEREREREREREIEVNERQLQIGSGDGPTFEPLHLCIVRWTKHELLLVFLLVLEERKRDAERESYLLRQRRHRPRANNTAPLALSIYRAEPSGERGTRARAAQGGRRTRTYVATMRGRRNRAES